jgi:hypothetical protein
LPQLHGPGTPPLAVPSCPTSNASTAFHRSLTRDLGHGVAAARKHSSLVQGDSVARHNDSLLKGDHGRSTEDS